ncbi:MAG: ABC transporter permease subunit [Acholeplasmatales bacterium]|nr:ABC transporter permease subunit [Acholeplasmatales bacterium]
MRNLLKSDLYRFFKSKQFIIICVIAGVFALVVPTLNFILEKVVANLEGAEQYVSELRASSGALNSMQSALNPGSLFGFLMPIFVSIVLASDFKDGTIRNKIIIGTSKYRVHVSSFLSTTIFIIIVMVGYGILSFIAGLIFFPVIPQSVDAASYIGNMFLTVLFDVLAYIFVASIILLLVNIFRTQGMSAFMYVVALFGFQFVGGIFSAIISAIKVYETNMDGLINFLSVFQWINPFQSMNTLAISDYSKSEIVSNIITPIAWSCINYYLAYLLLKKKDIK